MGCRQAVSACLPMAADSGGPWQVGCWSWTLRMTLPKAAHAGSYLLVRLGRRTHMPTSAARSQTGTEHCEYQHALPSCHVVRCAGSVLRGCSSRSQPAQKVVLALHSVASVVSKEAGVECPETPPLPWRHSTTGCRSSPILLLRQPCASTHQSGSSLLHCPTGAGLL